MKPISLNLRNHLRNEIYESRNVSIGHLADREDKIGLDRITEAYRHAYNLVEHRSIRNNESSVSLAKIKLDKALKVLREWRTTVHPEARDYANNIVLEFEVAYQLAISDKMVYRTSIKDEQGKGL